MKLTLTTTIPVVSYGNIAPQLEVEADTYEQALEVADGHLQDLWRRYYNKTPGSTRVKLDAFVGGSIYFDAQTHTYSNEAGEKYLSGSEYAKQFEEPFDQAGVSAAMAKKYGVSASDIVKMWELKAQISRDLGTSLHAAMELYGRYDGLAKKMERSANHDNPMVMEAVRQFYKEHRETAEYEVLVVDHAKKRAGRLDRLALGTDGRGFGDIIEDFKTDVNIQKKLPIYQRQLSFYAAILEAAGRRVNGLLVHHWDGTKWTTYELTKETIQ